jgi:pimeloyl-ACP methyl ester carboxylesterase
MSETKPLPPALQGDCLTLDARAGKLTYYCSVPATPIETTPLLLLHSINAAAGAHEVRPLFEHYSARRPVYAPDLPGYGKSERSARDYTPRLMTDAVLDMVAQIKRDHGDVAVDALGVSLTSEFVSRAAQESPTDFRSVALVSPTGLNRNKPLRGPSQSTRGMPWLLRTLTLPLLGKGLYRLLTSPPSVRFFLQKTWGSKQIDEVMYEYSCLATRQEGAHRAPFYFLSGFLFSADVFTVYESLTQPVWASHGVRGDFTDYRLKAQLEERDNWQFQVFDSGALPYFEHPDEFIELYEQFMEKL